MEKATFKYLNAECEYHYKNKNLYITSKHSYDSSDKINNDIISEKYNIKKSDIKTITFKYNNTTLPEVVYNYFSDYPNLEHIEINKLDFKNVKIIDGFIQHCPNIKTINIEHKNANNLIGINRFIDDMESLRVVEIQDITAAHLQEIIRLISRASNLKELTLKNLTAPNINYIERLISYCGITTLNLEHIGNVKTKTLGMIAANCDYLKTIEMEKVTKDTKIKRFAERLPQLKTRLLDKIERTNTLHPDLLYNTPTYELLDLNKFQSIKYLSYFLNCTRFSYSLISNNHNEIINQIIQGNHQLTLEDYKSILKLDIEIIDKTEDEIIRDIMRSAKNKDTKEIEAFLKEIKDDNKYKKELDKKLNIIKQLKG